MTFHQAAHPQTKRQLIRRSFSLYRHAFIHVIYLSFLLTIMAFVPRFVSLLVGQNIFLGLPAASPQRLWILAINLGSIILFTAIVWRTYCLIQHKHESLGEDITIGLKKVLFIFGGAILQSLLIVSIVLLFSLFIYYVILDKNLLLSNLNWQRQTLAILLFLCEAFIVIYLFLAFYFYVPTIVIENKGILSSLGKSFSLVKNNWWRTFFVQATPWFVFIICLMAIKYLIRIDINIFFIAPETNPPILATIIQILVFTLLIPWIAATLLVQLRDLELRKQSQF